jgi:hypothetical protein
MREPDETFGKPFDRLLLCGPQTESGRNLRDIYDVAPIVAEALLLLAETPLRETSAEVTDNITRRLDGLTFAGEPTAWGGLGIVEWEFSGRETAAYFVHQVVASLLSEWDSEPDFDDLQRRLRGAGHSNHLADVDEFMVLVQHDENGKPRLGDFGGDLVKSLRGRKLKAKELPGTLRAFEETFKEGVRRALTEASATASETASDFALAIEGETRSAVDEQGPTAGKALARAALEHLARLESTLEEQRETLRNELATAESTATEAFRSLKAAANRSRTGWTRWLRKPVSEYVEAASLAFRLRFAFTVTEAALAALAKARQPVQRLLADTEDLRQAFATVRERCRQLMGAFESPQPTPVTRVTCRPLYRVDDLHRLYRQTYGVEWGSASRWMSALTRHTVGGLSRWLKQNDGAIYGELLTACLPLFSAISSMNADGFVRWLSQERGFSPDLLLRNSKALAPVLCRYDRARLPEGGDFQETAFQIVGVPDRESSVFAGTPHGPLVSTGDPDRIIFVTLKFAFPASALWHYPRYRQAYEEIRRQRLVAQEIYPNFPYHVRDGWGVNGGTGSARGVQSAHRRARRRERGKGK